MLIVSWNVLYRAYEEYYKPDSAILKNYPFETCRVREIVNFLESNFSACNDVVVCLQECSYDLLVALQNTFSNFKVFYSCSNNKDYVITIAPKDYTVEYCTIPKCHNMLVIGNKKYRIVNCHLIPRRLSNNNSFDFINKLPLNKENIVAGDFNEQYKQVCEFFNNRYVITRFGNTYRSKQIDHIMLQRTAKLEIAKTVIRPTGELNSSLSDHRMIILEFHSQSEFH
jgi:hypothetical protein